MPTTDCRIARPSERAEKLTRRYRKDDEEASVSSIGWLLLLGELDSELRPAHPRIRTIAMSPKGSCGLTGASEMHVLLIQASIQKRSARSRPR